MNCHRYWLWQVTCETLKLDQRELVGSLGFSLLPAQSETHLPKLIKPWQACGCCTQLASGFHDIVSLRAALEVRRLCLSLAFEEYTLCVWTMSKLPLPLF